MWQIWCALLPQSLAAQRFGKVYKLRLVTYKFVTHPERLANGASASLGIRREFASVFGESERALLVIIRSVSKPSKRHYELESEHEGEHEDEQEGKPERECRRIRKRFRRKSAIKFDLSKLFIFDLIKRTVKLIPLLSSRGGGRSSNKR